MKKQDDASAGCALLAKAIEYESDGQLVTSRIIEQFDLITKWLACAICAKDHTTGQENILNILSDLFDFLMERGEKLSGIEAKAIPRLCLRERHWKNFAR